ncbi:MAG: DUF1573 domain-containing protein [Ferruginibacter sp.]
MRALLLFFSVAIIFFSCDIRRKDKVVDDAVRQAELIALDSTTVQLIDSVYDFGKITDGDKVEYKFRFKNTGNKPLVVSTASASCGCTVPEKPEKPILPGETGFIKVLFNSKGKGGGRVEKDVYVNANVNPSFPKFKLVGEVAKPKE